MPYSIQGDFIILHGPPGIGKTQTASSFPGPVVFLATEPGHRHLPKEQRDILYPINSWEDFTSPKLMEHLKKAKPKTVVIDTLVRLYMMCKQHICKKNRCRNPAERGDYGRTIWSMISDEFGEEFSKFAAQVLARRTTLVAITHTDEDTVSTQFEDYIRLMAALPTQVRRWVAGLADWIWFLGYNQEEASEAFIYNDERRLWLSGTPTVEAKCRDPKISQHLKSLVLPVDNQYEAIIKAMTKAAAKKSKRSTSKSK